MADFDQYGQTYSKLLDQCVALSGETSHYFADYKASYMAAALGASGRRKKILDYGCGVGLLSAALKKYFPGAIQHGYDVSAASISSVDTSLAQSGCFTSDLGRLDHDYDAIVMAAVLHHVPVGERGNIFRDLSDRLAANGKLIVFEHNPLNPVTRWVVKQCAFDRDAVLVKPQHVIEHMRDAELRVIRRDYIVFFPRLLSGCRPVERFLGWCPIGAQYVITAAKKSLTQIDEYLNMNIGIR